jgi:hypothetical protein
VREVERFAGAGCFTSRAKLARPAQPVVRADRLQSVPGAVAPGAFLWSLESGRYDDPKGAAERILPDDDL